MYFKTVVYASMAFFALVVLCVIHYTPAVIASCGALTLFTILSYHHLKLKQ